MKGEYELRVEAMLQVLTRSLINALARQGGYAARKWNAQPSDDIAAVFQSARFKAKIHAHGAFPFTVWLALNGTLPRSGDAQRAELGPRLTSLFLDAVRDAAPVLAREIAAIELERPQQGEDARLDGMEHCSGSAWALDDSQLVVIVRVPRMEFERALFGAKVRRAEELAAQALRRARTTAAEEERESLRRSRVLASLGRRLRGPLGAVLGSVELLLEDEKDPERAELLSTIAQASHELRELAEDLDDLARIEGGELRLDESSFDLVAMIDEVRRRVSIEAERSGLALRWFVNGVLDEPVSGDRGRLRQLIQYLVLQCVQLCPSTRLEVVVSLRRIAEAELLISTDVTATGTERKRSSPSEIRGAEELGQVGEHPALESGLCRRLVERLGGELSGPDPIRRAGPMMSLTLPMCVDLRLAPTPPKILEPVQLLQARRPVGTGPRVLVVEDEAMSREVVVRMLRKLGAQVEAAESGWVAIRQCAEHEFDLILMDLEMPGIDGFQTVRRLRSDARAGARATPVIALSATVGPEERARCLASGMDGYVAKPVRMADLRLLLRPHRAVEA